MDPLNKNEQFMNLYEPVHERLCRYVQTLVWQSDDAKDLISEVTLKAYENFETLKNKDQFIYFLFGITRNLYLKKLRKSKFQIRWNENEMEEIQGSGFADETLQKSELAVLLSKLERNQQEAITLFEVAGFSYDEIAEIQQTNLSNVKSRIFNARKSLKAFVEKEKMRLLNVEQMEPGSTINIGGLL